MLKVIICSVPYSDADTQPKKIHRPFSELEESEIEEHFHLKTRMATPTKTEIEQFLGNCTQCKGRNTKSIKNKVYYIIKKNSK